MDAILGITQHLYIAQVKTFQGVLEPTLRGYQGTIIIMYSIFKKGTGSVERGGAEPICSGCVRRLEGQ